MKKAAILVVFTGSLIGCDRSALPFLGNWTGTFAVQKNASNQPTNRLTMTGYIQIYRTGSKFIMEFANPVQTLDLTGTWKLASGTRIMLHFTKFKLTEPGSDVLDATSSPVLTPDQLHSAYTPDMILDLAPDKLHLTGLLMKIGPLLGRHQLVKTTMIR